MNYFKHIVAIILLGALFSCNAQKIAKTQDGIATDINGKWYSYTNDFSIRETVFIDGLWINTVTNPYVEDSKPRVDTSYFKKLKDNYYLLSRLRAKQKVVTKIMVDSLKTTMTIQFVAQGKDEAVLLDTYQSIPESPWTTLQEVKAYSKVRFDELKSAPGLDKISREDVIRSLKVREKISPMLLEYVKANPDEGKYRVFQMVNDYRNKVLVEMGYNPFKMLKGNPMKRFENDEEIMKLLNEPMSWEN